MTEKEAQKGLTYLDRLAVLWVGEWTEVSRKAYEALVRLFKKYGGRT